MRKGKVFCNKIYAGILIEHGNGGPYSFVYDLDYFLNPQQPAISLTMPKSRQEYAGEVLFPFFSNLIAEGVNRELQVRKLKIDEHDIFGLLLETAQHDTIGSVTVKPIEDNG